MVKINENTKYITMYWFGISSKSASFPMAMSCHVMPCHQDHPLPPVRLKELGSKRTTRRKLVYNHRTIEIYIMGFHIGFLMGYDQHGLTNWVHNMTKLFRLVNYSRLSIWIPTRVWRGGIVVFVHGSFIDEFPIGNGIAVIPSLASCLSPKNDSILGLNSWPIIT